MRRSTGWIQIVVVMVFIFEPSASTADPDSIEKIPGGRSVFFAAELGTTPDILGMGFERNLSMTDANGDTHRIYPNKIAEGAR